MVTTTAVTAFITQTDHPLKAELTTVAQHGRQPPPNAAIVELHGLLGGEAGENGFTLRIGQPTKIQLIVVAQKLSPLGGRRERAGRLQRDGQGFDIGGGQGVEQMLVDVEVAARPGSCRAQCSRSQTAPHRPGTRPRPAPASTP